VIGRSSAAEALEPVRKREGAMPCKGEARNVRSQVLWVVYDSQTDTCDKGHITEEPCAAKVCAVTRTDGIATRGGRSSGLMTPRRTTYLDPKGRGDKSMLGKRETAEDVYAVVLQRLNDRAKTGLCEPQSPGVEWHTRR
jgi:hypothetical protein